MQMTVLLGFLLGNNLPSLDPHLQQMLIKLGEENFPPVTHGLSKKHALGNLLRENLTKLSPRSQQMLIELGENNFFPSGCFSKKQALGYLLMNGKLRRFPHLQQYASQYMRLN